MSQHTQEPWAVNVTRQEEEYPCVTVIDASGRTLFQCVSYHDRPPETALGNASRIVGFINSGRGLATYDLEKTGLVGAVGYQLINLEAQRDDLLAALEKLTAEIKSIHESGDVGRCLEGLLLFSELAIAKAVQP